MPGFVLYCSTVLCSLKNHYSENKTDEYDNYIIKKVVKNQHEMALVTLP